MKFAQFEEWMMGYILWKFQIREQSSFLDVLYQSAFKRNKGVEMSKLLDIICGNDVFEQEIFWSDFTKG